MRRWKLLLASGVRLAEIGYVQTDYSKFRGDWKRP